MVRDTRPADIVPIDAGGHVPFEHSRSILAARQRLKVLVFGDSISNGMTASSYYRSFPWLWARHVREKYSAPVQVLNWSKGSRVPTASLSSRKRRVPACPTSRSSGSGSTIRSPSSRGFAARAPGRPRPSRGLSVEHQPDRLRAAGRSGSDVALVSPCRLPGAAGLRPVPRRPEGAVTRVGLRARRRHTRLAPRRCRADCGRRRASQ